MPPTPNHTIEELFGPELIGSQSFLYTVCMFVCFHACILVLYTSFRMYVTRFFENSGLGMAVPRGVVFFWAQGAPHPRENTRFCDLEVEVL